MAESAAPSRKNVVIVGGGLSGAVLAKALEQDADLEVTLVDSKEYFEIRWATLRALVEPQVAEKIIFPHSEYLKEANLVVGDVTSATDSQVSLSDDRTLPFDFLVIATGSSIEAGQSTEGRRAYFQQEHKKLKDAESVLVVGGGPTGVEMAGELVTDLPGKKVTLVHGGSRLLEFAGPKLAAKALAWLKAKGVEVVLEDRIEAVTFEQHGTSGEFKTAGGKEIKTDYLFVATGPRPDSSWLEGTFGAALNKSYVKVDPYFKVDGYDTIYAMGDVADLKEPKQGYLAQLHAHVVAHNIRATAKAAKSDKVPDSLKAWKPQPPVAAVSLGRKNGVVQLPFGTFSGFLPTTIKSKNLFVGKVRKELGLPA